MKKKKSRAERWTPSRLASLTENLLIPPPPSTTTAVPLPLLYFVFLCRFEAIWIGFAVLS